MLRRFLFIAALLILPSSLWANTCAGNANGFWRTAGSWTSCGGGVPGNGDTISTLNGHTITIDDARTVGTSGVTGTAAITIDASGQLLYAAGADLSLRGDVAVAGVFDGRLGNTAFDPPSMATYRVYTTQNGTIMGIGPTTTLTRGGGNGYYDYGPGFVPANIYVTGYIQKCGSSSQECINFGVAGASNVDIHGAQFVGDGTIRIAQSSATANFNVYNNDWRGCVDTSHGECAAFSNDQDQTCQPYGTLCSVRVFKHNSCAIAPNGLAGTVNISGGTAVTLATGSNFSTGWATQNPAITAIYLPSGRYDIASVIDSTHLTLASSAPNGSGVAYAAGNGGRLIDINIKDLLMGESKAGNRYTDTPSWQNYNCFVQEFNNYHDRNVISESITVDNITGQNGMFTTAANSKVTFQDSIIYTHEDNPHSIGETSGVQHLGPNWIKRSIFDGDNVHYSDTGDILGVGTDTDTYMVGNINIGQAGTWFSFNPTGSKIHVLANTSYNSIGAQPGETSGAADSLIEFRDNIIVNPSDGNGMHQLDAFVPSTNAGTSIDYNVFYSGMTASNLKNAALSNQPGYLQQPTVTAASPKISTAGTTTSTILCSTCNFTGEGLVSGDGIQAVGGTCHESVTMVNSATSVTTTNSCHNWVTGDSFREELNHLSTTASTTTTLVNCTGCNFTAMGVGVGDVVVTTGGNAPVTIVNSATQLTLGAGGISGLTSSTAFTVRGSYIKNYAYGITAGYGTHDMYTDPQFVDSTRTLAAYDTAQGGPGTIDHFGKEAIKLNGFDINGGTTTFNTAYLASNISLWVYAGYVPQNTALSGAGSPTDFSPTIGAVLVKKSTTVANPVSSVTTDTYGNNLVVDFPNYVAFKFGDGTGAGSTQLQNQGLSHIWDLKNDPGKGFDFGPADTGIFQVQWGTPDYPELKEGCQPLTRLESNEVRVKWKIEGIAYPYGNCSGFPPSPWITLKQTYAAYRYNNGAAQGGLQIYSTLGLTNISNPAVYSGVTANVTSVGTVYTVTKTAGPSFSAWPDNGNTGHGGDNQWISINGNWFHVSTPCGSCSSTVLILDPAGTNPGNLTGATVFLSGTIQGLGLYPLISWANIDGTPQTNSHAVANFSPWSHSAWQYLWAIPNQYFSQPYLGLIPYPAAIAASDYSGQGVGERLPYNPYTGVFGTLTKTGTALVNTGSYPFTVSSLWDSATIQLASTTFPFPTTAITNCTLATSGSVTDGTHATLSTSGCIADGTYYFQVLNGANLGPLGDIGQPEPGLLNQCFGVFTVSTTTYCPLQKQIPTTTMQAGMVNFWKVYTISPSGQGPGTASFFLGIRVVGSADGEHPPLAAGATNNYSNLIFLGDTGVITKTKADAISNVYRGYADGAMLGSNLTWNEAEGYWTTTRSAITSGVSWATAGVTLTNPAICVTDGSGYTVPSTMSVGGVTLNLDTDYKGTISDSVCPFLFQVLQDVDPSTTIQLTPAGGTATGSLMRGARFRGSSFRGGNPVASTCSFSSLATGPNTAISSAIKAFGGGGWPYQDITTLGWSDSPFSAHMNCSTSFQAACGANPNVISPEFTSGDAVYYIQSGTATKHLVNINNIPGESDPPVGRAVINFPSDESIITNGNPYGRVDVSSGTVTSTVTPHSGQTPFFNSSWVTPTPLNALINSQNYTISAYANTSSITITPGIPGGLTNAYFQVTNAPNLDQITFVIDKDNCFLAEGYHSLYDPFADQWSFGNLAIWDLNATTVQQRPVGWTASGASALPITFSALRYDEAHNDTINHQIRGEFASGNTSFQLPASHIAGNADWPYFPGTGEVMVLNSSFDCTLGGTASLDFIGICHGLKNYGMITEDYIGIGNNTFLDGFGGPWDVNLYSQLNQIHQTDFKFKTNNGTSAPTRYGPWGGYQFGTINLATTSGTVTSGGTFDTSDMGKLISLTDATYQNFIPGSNGVTITGVSSCSGGGGTTGCTGLTLSPSTGVTASGWHYLVYRHPVGPSPPDYLPSGLTTPTIMGFSASAYSGGCSDLTWSVTSTTWVNIVPDVGPVHGTSGVQHVCPMTTTAYTLTATNTGGAVGQSVTVDTGSNTGWRAASQPLVALWDFHANTLIGYCGGQCDASGNGHFAYTSGGNPTLLTAQTGYNSSNSVSAAHIDSGTGHFLIGQVIPFSWGTGSNNLPYTIVALVKPASGGGGPLIDCASYCNELYVTDTNSVNNRYSIHDQYNCTSPTCATATTTPSHTAFNFLAASYIGATANFWYNGSPDGVGVSTGNQSASLGWNAIGYELNAGNSFNGDIEAIAIYAGQLTNTDVSNLNTWLLAHGY